MMGEKSRETGYLYRRDFRWSVARNLSADNIPVVSGDLSPLISRFRDSFPPEGKPSLHRANIANTTLNNASNNASNFRSFFLLCSAKEILQKASPRGKLSRKRLMRGIKFLLRNAYKNSRIPLTQGARQPHSVTTFHLPNQQKLPPSPRHSQKANRIFAS